MSRIGHVYKLKNLINNKCYVGSTFQKLYRRKNSHFYDAKTRGGTSKLHVAILKYGNKNFKIMLIEDIGLCSRDELRIKETEYIKKLETINNGYNHRNGFTGEEERKKQYKIWAEKNKDKRNKQSRIRYNNNLEKNRKWAREWRLKNLERSKEIHKKYRLNNKEKCKKMNDIYRLNNREKILQNYKDYWIKNKEAISKKRAKKITCECGSIVSISYLYGHKRTNKHLLLIKK